MSQQAVFTLCIRPDCPNVPRYCSVACGQNLEGQPDALGEACALLRRAADEITSVELSEGQTIGDAQLLPDIGAFLARVPS